MLQAALLRLVGAVDVTLLDRSAVHLPDPRAWPVSVACASRFDGRCARSTVPGLERRYRRLLLLLHHLEPPQIVRYLAEAQRVARVAVVINDLERSAIHYRLAQLNRILDPSRISRHDGPVSVRRAYTRRELARMLTDTGRSFHLERAWLYRLGAVLWCGQVERSEVKSDWQFLPS